MRAAGTVIGNIVPFAGVIVRLILIDKASIDPRSGLSVTGVSLSPVDVSAEVVARVPRDNLGVSLGEFSAVWSRAERIGSRLRADDAYLVGVILTCRWLAAQPVWSAILNRAEMPMAPLTGGWDAAMPETMEAELVAAYSRRAISPARANGVAATLEWAWRGSRRAPLEVGNPAAG
jgi:hypothetical protein